MSNWYREHVAVDGTVELERVDLLTGARTFEDRANRWMLKHEEGGMQVSTVFLALDHNFTPGAPPVLYETMVFGGPLDQEQERYCTRAEAEAGHAAMIEKVRDVLAGALKL